MRIDRLDLRNFRNFEADTFHFPTQVTVIIGENGKGKSTILQGLRVAAATYLMGIDEAERYHIQKEDVRRIDLQTRFVPQDNCSFSASGVLSGQQVSWGRTLPKPGGRTDTKDAQELIGLAKSLNDQVNRQMKEDVDLPVIGYFSTARLWVEPKQTVKLKTKGSRLKDGYARCMDDSSDKKSAFEWVKSAYWKKLKEKPESVLLAAVLEALDICIPNWTPQEWDEDSDDLKGRYTYENGTNAQVPLYYLSDGLRTMAAMVAEIAYRCVVLNAHYGRDAVKQSKGIVLVDEIDMHLHPKWQQSVIADLKRAFPNIQFIVTTHSPFIVQSVAANELINLDRKIEEDPNKLTIQDVAAYVMQVEPHSLAYQSKFDLATRYLSALDNQQEERGAMDLELIEQEQEVKDPAFAAFLKMNRLAKQEKGDRKA